MSHDHGRKDSNGNNCVGYMDYDDDTNYWSSCSVEDFIKTKKGCLKPATPQNKGKFIRQFTYLYGILTLVEIIMFEAINLPEHIATSEFHFRN